MSEPYEELSPQELQQTVRILRRWAATQENPDEPFLEILDGCAITPRDLLSQAPPGRAGRFLDERSLGSRVREMARGLLSPEEAYAWRHILNLVAFNAQHGEESLDEMLAVFSRFEDAGGSVGPAVT